MTFYVYCWTNRVNGKRYIGKGKGRRDRMHTMPFSDSLVARAARKHGANNLRVVRLVDGLSEAEAFAMEMYFIRAGLPKLRVGRMAVVL